MFRALYALIPVVMAFVLTEDAQAQYYNYGPSRSVANSCGYYPVGGFPTYGGSHPGLYQPIHYGPTSGPAYGGYSCGQFAHRPVLFPRLRRLVRRILPPYGVGY